MPRIQRKYPKLRATDVLIPTKIPNGSPLPPESCPFVQFVKDQPLHKAIGPVALAVKSRAHPFQLVLVPMTPALSALFPEPPAKNTAMRGSIDDGASPP